MKNQYFGDNRDLFKYDLVFHIIQEGLANRFVFIPMLTPNVQKSKNARREGEQRNRLRAKAGYKNEVLKEFLNKFGDRRKRSIKHMDFFFRNKGVSITTFGEYFNCERREDYFQKAWRKFLPKSVICVDPDIGLEVKRSREEHILYSEVKELYELMNKNSLLMIFQFIPREKRDIYFPRICGELKQKVGNLPIYISDNQVAFFFLAKDKSLRESLGNTLRNYKDCYPELRIDNI